MFNQENFQVPIKYETKTTKLLPYNKPTKKMRETNNPSILKSNYTLSENIYKCICIYNYQRINRRQRA